ncbi:hypothetical protein ASG48_10940 [Aurantimonas sp. Leaf443]|nr:hypothetical protein ASG48_10940 [Aurantimonas sp. Leaf443]
MGDLTIHGIDDDVIRRLELRAAARGRSLDDELRLSLDRLSRDEDRSAGRVKGEASDDEREARLRRILALGRPLDAPFDLKAYSDALSDGTE